MRLRGELIQPGDETYDAARTVFWAHVDRYPALIVRIGDEHGMTAGEDYSIGTMIELPRACFQADLIATHADFFDHWPLRSGGPVVVGSEAEELPGI